MIWKYRFMSTVVLILAKLEKRSEKASGPLALSSWLPENENWECSSTPISSPQSIFHEWPQFTALHNSSLNIQSVVGSDWKALIVTTGCNIKTIWMVTDQWHPMVTPIVQDCNQSQSFKQREKRAPWSPPLCCPPQEQEAQPQGLPAKYIQSVKHIDIVAGTS